MAKVVIDAGHGGMDYGAVYNGRREKDDNLNLALLTGKKLEDEGYEVVYTRTTDVYDTPYQKAAKGNESGADVFVSIHRNAFATPNTGSGIETLVFDNSGIKADLAENINKELENLGFRNLGVIERPNLVVLKRTQMPSVLVEAGFIDNDSDNELLDNNYEETAMAIANGIINTFPINEQTQYKVQVGLFRNKENAEALKQELQEEGFESYLEYDNNYYVVYTGVFNSLDNAENRAEILNEKGYATYITSE